MNYFGAGPKLPVKDYCMVCKKECKDATYFYHCDECFEQTVINVRKETMRLEEEWRKKRRR